jgi:uncharacterized protein with PIN domain
MSKLYRCDRCRNEFNGMGYHVSIRAYWTGTDSPLEYMGPLWSMAVSISNALHPDQIVCPNCKRELVAFLSKPTVQEAEQVVPEEQ